MGRYMLFGVGTARRGWVEPASVVNTRPLAELRRCSRETAAELPGERSGGQATDSV